MTPTRREEDPGLVSFARRVGLVATAALAVIALSQMLFAQVTRDIRAGLVAESRARVVADSLQAVRAEATDRRLDRLVGIMEPLVFVMSGQANPDETGEAVRQLRRARRFVP